MRSNDPSPSIDDTIPRSAFVHERLLYESEVDDEFERSYLSCESMITDSTGEHVSTSPDRSFSTGTTPNDNGIRKSFIHKVTHLNQFVRFRDPHKLPSTGKTIFKSGGLTPPVTKIIDRFDQLAQPYTNDSGMELSSIDAHFEPWKPRQYDYTFPNSNQFSKSNSDGNSFELNAKKMEIYQIQPSPSPGTRFICEDEPSSYETHSLDDPSVILHDIELGKDTLPDNDLEEESSYSDNETDWESEDETASSYAKTSTTNYDDSCTFLGSGGDVDPLTRNLFSCVRKNLIDRIMRDFYAVFNEIGAGTTRESGDTPGSATHETTSSCEPAFTTAQLPGSQKQRRSSQEGDEDDPNEDDRNPKRPKKFLLSPRSLDIRLKFACPYRKHDPLKYCVNVWRPCALTPLETVARVKGHLYRHHRIFQCQRCKERFQNQELVDEHLLVVQACEVSSAKSAEGITTATEKRLRSRKKSHRDQSEEDRWKEVYQIIFPDAVVPNPYFEPIQEETMQSPNSQELSNYEEYARRELPQLVRSALETMAEAQVQSIEESLRGQLMSIVQDCQDTLFSAYRSLRVPAHQLTKNSDNPSQTGMGIREEQTIPGGPSVDALENFYHQPPTQGDLDSILELPPLNTAHKLRQLRNSDSGYGSDPFGVVDSQNNTSSNPNENNTAMMTKSQVTQVEKGPAIGFDSALPDTSLPSPVDRTTSLTNLEWWDDSKFDDTQWDMYEGPSSDTR